MAGDLAPGRLVLAGPVSLSGRYAALGRLAADGLRQVVDDVANAGGVEVGGRTLIPVLVLLDDEGTPDGVRRRLDAIGGADVLVDFAHNPHGIAAIFELARARPAKRRLMLIGQAGDRSDEAIRELAARAWGIGLDKVIIKEMPQYARGRPPGEVASLIKNALLACGADDEQLGDFATEPEAVSAALEWAQPGDMLILFIHEQIDEVLAMLNDAKNRATRSA